MSSQDEDNETTLSIGAVSQATGIPSETLRTWERRYGFPSPDRTFGGHRAYKLETIERLRLINLALEQGHRPGQVVGEPVETLEKMLEVTDPTLVEEFEPKRPMRIENPSEQVNIWLEAAQNYDADLLERTLTRAWYMMGPMTFLDIYIARFLTEIGEHWERGDLTVAQEHFASERLRDFLSSHWRPISDRSQGPRVLCATLPGEQHALGLHMAALVMALSGCRIIFLGANTPIEDILSTSKEIDGIKMVLLSLSKASNKLLNEQMVEQLRQKLDPSLSLVIGGDGAPFGVEGVTTLEDLRGLEKFIPRFFDY